MPIAGNITLKTVTGTYVDYQGTAIAGQMKFTMNSRLRNAIADQIVVPSTVTLTLDSNGSFSTTLPATNDPEFSETFTYTVEEAFAGGRTYNITLPESGAATLDMTDLAPTGTFPEYFSYVSASTWTVLDADVQTLDLAVDQTNGGFNYFNPAYEQVKTKTYSYINSTFADYAALTAGPLVISAADLDDFVSQAQTQETAALASQASAEAQLASVTSAEAERLDLFFTVGA